MGGKHPASPRPALLFADGHALRKRWAWMVVQSARSTLAKGSVKRLVVVALCLYIRWRKRRGRVRGREVWVGTHTARSVQWRARAHKASSDIRCVRPQLQRRNAVPTRTPRGNGRGPKHLHHSRRSLRGNGRRRRVGRKLRLPRSPPRGASLGRGAATPQGGPVRRCSVRLRQRVSASAGGRATPPPELDELRAAAQAAVGISCPGRDLPLNQCIVNRYLPGEGTGPHTDHPLLGPVVAVVTLGAQRSLAFTPTAAVSAASILALTRHNPGRAKDAGVSDAKGFAGRHSLHTPRGSIYVIARAARWDWRHEMGPLDGTTTCYSVTFRSVPFVAVQAGDHKVRHAGGKAQVCAGERS